MRIVRLGILLGVVGLAAVGEAPAAWAAPTNVAKSRALEREAVKHYNVGDYERALELYRQAYLATPDPVFLFNMGQCSRKLGRLREALDLYRSFIRNAPNSPQRPDVERRVAELERELARTGAPENKPPPATAPRSPAPAPAPGSQANAALVPPSAPAAEPGREPALVDATRAQESEKPASDPFYKKPWFWGVTGAVLVGAVAAAVLLSGRGRAADVNCPDCGFMSYSIPAK